MRIFVFTALLSVLFSLGTVRSTVAGTPYLPYTLSIDPASKKAFHGPDSIEVSAIIGTAPKLQVGGTYRVVGVCRQEAVRKGMLYVGNTTGPGGAMAIVPLTGSSLYKTCASGLTGFDVTFKLLRPGVLHVTIYDQENHSSEDNAYAGIFLGEVATPR